MRGDDELVRIYGFAFAMQQSGFDKVLLLWNILPGSKWKKIPYKQNK